MNRNIFVVYCRECGYDVKFDTGKRFDLETDAIEFVRAQRAKGHTSWFEQEEREIFDA
jgi:hypothetical protein